MRDPIIALAKRRGEGQNAGLLLQRYLAKAAAGEDGDPQERRDLFSAARRAAQSEPLRQLYAEAFRRWSASCDDGIHAQESLRTSGRLVIGLGAQNVLEAGLRLHQTYGVPVIPGSALKGLAAHYCHDVWGDWGNSNAGEQSRGFRNPGLTPEEGKYHKLLFGQTDDGGVIAFHDAWLAPESLAQDGGAVCLDVMTPHHPKWQTDQLPPSDFDSPNPVTFLAVQGRFHVRVSWVGPCETPEPLARQWTDLAFKLLKSALADWGVGGKTNSGYGRLVDIAAPKTATAKVRLARRASGTPARVRLTAARPRGGFDVQDVEEGRPAGTLTLGTPPSGVDARVGDVVQVLVHVDDPNRPQYKWPRT